MRNRLNNLDLGRFRSPIVLGVIGGLILLLLIWWFAWMSPEANKLTTVQAQQTQLNQQVEQLQAKITQLQQESAQVQKELPYLVRYTAAAPPTPEQGLIVNQILALSKRTGVDLSSISDNTVSPPAVAGGLSTIPVDLVVSGNHSQVLNFLNGFYQLPRLMTISTLALDASGGSPNILDVNDGASYSLTMAATAYTLATPATPAA